MSVLLEKLPVYKCPNCEHRGQANQWIDCEYEGLSCEGCGDKVVYDGDTETAWWSVALYAISRAYGGPEEGGWWYDTGELCAPWHVRGFDNYEEAKEYYQQLRNDYQDERDVRVLGFNEKLPVKSFPETRPYYS